MGGRQRKEKVPTPPWGAEGIVRDLFEASPIGIYRADLEGRFLQVNAAQANLYGFASPGEMLLAFDTAGKTLWEHPEARAAFLGRVLASPGHYHQGEARFHRKDGTPLVAQVDMMLTTTPGTGEPCLVGFVQDLTGKRRTEEALLTNRKQSEHKIERLRADLTNIIDSMPSLLVGLDEAGTITQWNREAAAATGVRADGALGRAFAELLPDFAPRVAALRADVARLGQASAKEKLLLDRAGERTAFEVMVYPLTDPGSGGVVVRIEDVTERARLQELLVQAEKLMSIGGLATGMAHEINNPLGIISQAAQNIGRRLTADLPANREAAQAAGLDLAALQRYLEDRRIRPFLDSIQEAVGRATRIVGNLLELSRKPESARTSASLLEVVQRTLELAARDYDLKKRFAFGTIVIQMDAEPDLPPVPMVVPEIEQVLLNLLKNAAQAMAANGPDRPRRLTLRLRREPAHVALVLEVNGPGMAEPVRRRIFEPFFTTRGPGLGTGLGLSVSYMVVVQNHGGSLEVASEEGQGTRFTLRLPLADAHA